MLFVCVCDQTERVEGEKALPLGWSHCDSVCFRVRPPASAIFSCYYRFPEKGGGLECAAKIRPEGASAAATYLCPKNHVGRRVWPNGESMLDFHVDWAGPADCVSWKGLWALVRSVACSSLSRSAPHNFSVKGAGQRHGTAPLASNTCKNLLGRRKPTKSREAVGWGCVCCLVFFMLDLSATPSS